MWVKALCWLGWHRWKIGASFKPAPALGRKLPPKNDWRAMRVCRCCKKTQFQRLFSDDTKGPWTDQ